MNIIQKSSILFLCLSGCSLFSYRSFNYQGFNIYDRQLDTDMRYDQMRTIIDYSFSKLGNKDLFSGYDIVFTSAWIGQNRPDGLTNIADGITDIKNRVMYIKVKKCIWDTAIIHEMAHVIHYENSKIYDVNHDDISFWSIIDSLEEEAVRLCPDGYVKTKRIH